MPKTWTASAVGTEAGFRGARTEFEAPVSPYTSAHHSAKGGIATADRKGRLSTLWIFATLNYVYADVLALFDITKGSGLPSSPQFTQGLLLGASVLVEIPILMVFLARELPYKANRWANILAGIVETVAVLFAQFISPIMNGTTTSYYLFFGAIEIPTTLFIIWYAWTWHKAEVSDIG